LSVKYSFSKRYHLKYLLHFWKHNWISKNLFGIAADYSFQKYFLLVILALFYLCSPFIFIFVKHDVLLLSSVIWWIIWFFTSGIISYNSRDSFVYILFYQIFIFIFLFWLIYSWYSAWKNACILWRWSHYSIEKLIEWKVLYRRFWIR
jgi:hypothetical protein